MIMIIMIIILVGSSWFQEKIIFFYVLSFNLFIIKCFSRCLLINYFWMFCAELGISLLGMWCIEHVCMRLSYWTCIHEVVLLNMYQWGCLVEHVSMWLFGWTCGCLEHLGGWPIFPFGQSQKKSGSVGKRSVCGWKTYLTCILFDFWN